MNKALMPTLIAAVVTALGWLVTTFLAKVKEDNARRDQAALRYLERQIEELYAPLLGLMEYLYIVYEIEQQRKQVRRDDEQTEVAHRFFIERYYMPLNARMAEMIENKVHLLKDGVMPSSFRTFLEHVAYQNCLYNLWKETKQPSDFVKGVGYPADFDTDVRSSLDQLTAEYAHLIHRVVKRRTERPQ